MTSPAPEPISLATADGALRVSFRWAADRFVHRIELRGRLSATSVKEVAAESLSELSSGQPVEEVASWPASPPLQQLSREDLGGTTAVLGVGAAGRSHWSLSVEASGSGGRSSLVFDWACRVKEAPTLIGSTYRVEPSLEIIPLANTNVRRLDEGVVQLFPEEPWEGPTLRWRYRIAPRLERETTTE